MSLIHPQGKLVYYPPEYDGMTTVFGLSRDWRPSRDWWLRGIEWIEPLKAFGPAGWYRPAAMDLSDWDVVGNDRFREITVAGNPPVTWLQFYDGQPYLWTDPVASVFGSLQATAAADDYMPRLCLWLKRQTPPPGQQWAPQVTLAVNALSRDVVGGAWAEGRVALYLPLQGDADSATTNRYDSAMLCHATLTEAPLDAFWDVFSSGRILSQGPKGPSAGNKVIEEGWLLEYEEVWLDDDGSLWAEDDGSRTFVSSHILIRHIGDSMGDWWVYSSDRLRLTTGDAANDKPAVSINVAGAIQTLNCTWINYGGVDGTAIPNRGQVLGHADQETSATWASLHSQATGWLVSTTGYTGYGATTYAPQVTTQRQWLYAYTGAEPWNIRPIIWCATEDHAATVVPQGGSSEDTTGHSDLKRITYTLNDKWKGAQGTAEFYGSDTERHTGWRENGLLEVYLGWQTGAGTDLAEQLVATAYIAPEGIKRQADGGETEGPYRLTLDFGDFGATRAQSKAVLDMRQAGGRTVSDWAYAIANRMGLPDTMVDVDPTLASQVIPVHEIPSTANLEARDGDSWLGHIQAVENAADIRVGWRNDGVMFVDAGSPDYEPGVSTIAFTLDETSVTPEDIIYQAEATGLGARFRNVLKATFGREDRRTDYYWVEPEADRLAGIGDDWPVVITDDDARYAGDIGARFNREHYDTQQGALRWDGPCRPGLLPDMFVEVSALSGLGVEVDSVYRITSHQLTMDVEAFDAGSSITMVLVYPTEIGYSA